MSNDPKNRSLEDGDEIQLVEISSKTLDELLQKADLEIGKNVRVIKALEIQPGAVIAKQYDR